MGPTPIIYIICIIYKGQNRNIESSIYNLFFVNSVYKKNNVWPWYFKWARMLYYWHVFSKEKNYMRMEEYAVIPILIRNFALLQLRIPC